MKYILAAFYCFTFSNSFAQLVNPSDTFASETFAFLKEIDSSILPQAEKNKLQFERIKLYVSKNRNDIWYGQQLLRFAKYFDSKQVDTLFSLFDTSTQNQMNGLLTPLKIRSKLLPGNTFPELILIDSLKRSLKVVDLKGKLVLIDIWASWCKPCRAEMPRLIALYEKYKQKGFVVIAISLDEHKEKWLQAIRDDSLPWIHFCDLVETENNILSTKWGIVSIPYNFLIDKNGILVDKEMSLDKLEIELLKL